MFTILSPAKRQQFDEDPFVLMGSERLFQEETACIVAQMREKSVEELASLLAINHELAKQAYASFQSDNFHQLSYGVSALSAYQGDVYRAMNPDSLDKNALCYLQKYLGIVSGLYGLLRPMDRICPYRLEMTTPVNELRLAKFWSDKLVAYLQGHDIRVVINLASKAYADAIIPYWSGPVITPVFKDYRRDAWRVIGVLAKRARGQMLRYIAENQCQDPQDIQHFSALGYSFQPSLSDESTWVFHGQPTDV